MLCKSASAGGWKLAVSKDPARIEGMFARIVGRYDTMNRLMTWGMDRAWRRLTVELAQPWPGAPALDVGCGTGDLTLELAGRCSLPMGLDFCSEMLEAAQRKARGQGHELALVQGDAHHLPFPDRVFGCVVSGFALRNVQDLQAVLKEMYRVTSPGGRMASLELTPPGPGLLGKMNDLYQRLGIPFMGRLVAGDAAAYTYLPTSVAAFPPADELSQLIREAGWSEVGYRKLGFGAVAIHYGQRPKVWPEAQR